MPYKFNETRRHKIPKSKYRVTNWPQYDAALLRRGSLTLWFTEEAVAAWRAESTGKRGAQRVYSALAIETALAMRLVFHQALRQTEGLLRSVASLLGLALPIPDYTTLSRRGGGLRVLPAVVSPDEPLHILVDSTGLEDLRRGRVAPSEAGRPTAPVLAQAAFGAQRRQQRNRRFRVDSRCDQRRYGGRPSARPD
jgi:Transposase DDE domain